MVYHFTDKATLTEIIWG